MLAIYFVIAFVISWTIWIPIFLTKNTGSIASALVLVGLFGPAISALIVTAKASGPSGVRKLLSHYKILKFGATFYLMAFLLVPAMFLLSAFAPHVLNPTQGSRFTESSILFVVLSFVYLMFVNSGEEIGWRGYALPSLLKHCSDHSDSKRGALIASLILGVIWAIWHLPEYLIPGQSAGFPYPLFFAFTVGISVSYTALYNNTRGSLFAVTAFHASTDVMPRILQIGQFTVTNWAILIGLTWLVVLVLVKRLGPDRLSSTERLYP